MGLLSLYRRFWIVIALVLLAAPMAAQATLLSEDISQDEARRLASWPDLPRRFAAWRALPRDLDRYLGDHFGFRTELTRLHSALRFAVMLPSDPRVLVGRGRQLFLTDDGAVLQSLGELVRPDEIASSADVVAEFDKRLRARGVRLVFAIPPNGATIMHAALPEWAAAKPVTTEYDLMLKALAARGITAVDLRPALTAANLRYPVFRYTDSHWNNLGALAGYNAVAEAMGRGDWRIDVARVLRGFITTPGGDLARILGIADKLSDLQAQIDLSSYGALPAKVTRIDTRESFGGRLIDSARTGPTVVVLGDSFTEFFWQEYFGLHVGRYIWLYYDRCRFPRELVYSFKPEVVIVAPTERLLPCKAPEAS